MMTDEMSIEQYLASGGVLTSPDNAPPRYRAELLRLMASFVDSELAGAAGFADFINHAPGVDERTAAARIVSEKSEHAAQVLRIMGEFGASIDKYAGSHPWHERLSREADIGASRAGGDMRLAVFCYPFTGWGDAVVMNVLMGNAVVIQLEEFSKVSYQPLAEAFRGIAPREARHARLGEAGLKRLVANPGSRAAAQASLEYWWPRVDASFGPNESPRAKVLRNFGIRHQTNAQLRQTWQAMMRDLCKSFGLATP